MDTGNLQGILTKHRDKIIGPWQCDSCGNLSQYAEVTRYLNRIFCRNEACRYTRLIDKRHSRIIENDGTAWAFDQAGNKWRVRL